MSRTAGCKSNFHARCLHAFMLFIYTNLQTREDIFRVYGHAWFVLTILEYYISMLNTINEVQLGLTGMSVVLYPEGVMNVCTKFHCEQKKSSTQLHQKKTQGMVTIIRLHPLVTVYNC